MLTQLAYTLVVVIFSVTRVALAKRISILTSCRVLDAMLVVRLIISLAATRCLTDTSALFEQIISRTRLAYFAVAAGRTVARAFRTFSVLAVIAVRTTQAIIRTQVIAVATAHVLSLRACA